MSQTSPTEAQARSTGGTVQVVAFTLGGEEYALPIDQIREVIRYTRPRPVASTDPNVLGVISLRGKIVPISDLAGHVSTRATDEQNAKIVIVEPAADVSAGVIVDDVKEVLTIEEDAIEPPAGSRRQTIARLGERLVILLDINDLVTDAQPA